MKVERWNLGGDPDSGVVWAKDYDALAARLLARIDAALSGATGQPSSALGQGVGGGSRSTALEGVARAEAVVTPGTPGGGATDQPSVTVTMTDNTAPWYTTPTTPPLCSKCHKPYFSHPRLGLSHVCTPDPTPAPQPNGATP